MDEEQKRKYKQFKDELENMDTGMMSDLYGYLDETDADRHFMTECLLEWTNGNEVVLDDAMEHLNELKNKNDHD